MTTSPSTRPRPQTAVAGATTIVFENSEATGNTMGMPHTLTFDVSDPEYNNDVPLNILANPNDDQGGRHTAEVTLTPGRYRYYCTIPGHGADAGHPRGDRGQRRGHHRAGDVGRGHRRRRTPQGAYVGSATVAVSATDDGRLGRRPGRVRDRRRRRLAAVHHTRGVDQVGTHKVRYRAVDKAGNVAAEKSVAFTVVAPPTDDTTAAGDLGDGEPVRRTGRATTSRHGDGHRLRVGHRVGGQHHRVRAR